MTIDGRSRGRSRGGLWGGCGSQRYIVWHKSTHIFLCQEKFQPTYFPPASVPSQRERRKENRGLDVSEVPMPKRGREDTGVSANQNAKLAAPCVVWPPGGARANWGGPIKQRLPVFNQSPCSRTPFRRAGKTVFTGD